MEEKLKDMLGKKPEELEGETLKLFEAIMKIADERDELRVRNKELEEENKELKKDIKNMYDEEVVINIISDEFNLTRSEVLGLLGEEED